VLLKFLLASVLFAVMIPAFAQEASLLTVDVSKETYSQGETIVVSGKVQAVIPTEPVLIQIIQGSGRIVDVAQIAPAEDGSFIFTIQAKGKQWQDEGEYTARASYVSNVAEANFNFLTREDSGLVEGSFEVEIPGSTSTADVGYTVRGGSVRDMVIDDTAYSLIATVEPTEGGTLTLELPRDLIDAKTNGCEGGDGEYIVSIDGVQIKDDILETGKTNSNRVVSIEFLEGDSDIEITGTCVIPEFGGMALAILAVSVISIVALSRKGALKI